MESNEIHTSELAEQLIAQGLLTKEELAFYQSLKIKKQVYNKRLSIQAPTWEMRDPVLSLDDFLEKLADPETRDSARRDFASIPGGSQKPFFRTLNLLTERADKDRVCPINDGTGEINSTEDITFDSDLLKPSANSIYTLTADLSVSGDKTGVAMVHFDMGTQRVVLDFSVRIQAKGSRIDYEPIRNLARNLRKAGFRIAIVGFDQFQSNDSFIILEKEGFLCEIVKYSDSLMGCNTLHDFVSSGKLLYGECDKAFIGEATELQVINERRIDHMKAGGIYNSKDVWDAVVNAVVLCTKVTAEEHGEFLQAEDVEFFTTEEVTTVLPLKTEESVLLDTVKIKRQLPNTGHAVMAFVYCRYNSEVDSDTVCIAVAAVSMKDNICKLLEVHKLKKTPEGMIRFLVKLEKEWQGKKFFTTRTGQSLEIFIPDMPFVDKIEDKMAEIAPNLDLTRTNIDLSRKVRIMGAQTSARDKKLQFPIDYEKSMTLRAAFNQLVSYPFTPNEYTLLALEGISREAEDADFTIPIQTSKVISSEGILSSGSW